MPAKALWIGLVVCVVTCIVRNKCSSLHEIISKLVQSPKASCDLVDFFFLTLRNRSTFNHHAQPHKFQGTYIFLLNDFLQLEYTCRERERRWQATTISPTPNQDEQGAWDVSGSRHHNHGMFFLFYESKFILDLFIFCVSPARFLRHLAAIINIFPRSCVTLVTYLASTRWDFKNG